MFDVDACYAALESRDRRFDGRFFVGVRSTGVYCRPICPARTPRRDGVEFFPSAAAAHRAGYRACMRCRPETAPATAAWNGTEATVQRALRLIEDGALDRGTVGALATRLGIGERHLRGLFGRHLGASPQSVALGRRLRHARMLIGSTNLAMAEVAHGSGFKSIRRFNDAIRRAFGRAPTELRRHGGKAPLTVRLHYRPPHRFTALLAYLARRAFPGLESVEDGTWSHLVEFDGQRDRIEVRDEPERCCVVVRVPTALSMGLPFIVRRVRRAFDLDADPQAVHARLAGLDLPLGTRLPGAFNPFAVSVRVILGQQVSVAAASTLAGRLAERWGVPNPQVLAQAPLETIGLPGARARALRAFSQAVVDQTLSFETPSSLSTLLQALTSLPGIGPWTASMLALRAYAEPDAFPAGDLVLRRALGPDPEATAAPWRPWRGYAAMAVWEAHANAGVSS